MAVFLKRIPAEALKECQSWDMPEVSKGKTVKASNQKKSLHTQKRESAPQNAQSSNSESNWATESSVESVESVEVVEEDIELKPITAEQLEEMAKTAEKEGYDTGFAKGLEEGKEKGLEEGKQQGLDETKKIATEQAERLQHLMDALLNPLKQEQEKLEQQLIQWVCDLTKAVVQRELLSDSSQIEKVVQESLALLASDDDLTLTINPQDQQHIESLIDNYTAPVNLQTDETLLPGGCRLENKNSHINHTVEQRLAEILSQFSQPEKDNVDTDNPEANSTEINGTETNSTEAVGADDVGE